MRFFDHESTAFFERIEPLDLSPKSCIQCTVEEFAALVLAHSVEYYPIRPSLLREKPFYEYIENMLERHQKLIGDRVGAKLHLVTDGFNNYFFRVRYTQDHHLLYKQTFEHLLPNYLRMHHLFPTLDSRDLQMHYKVELSNNPTHADLTIYQNGTLLLLPEYLSHTVSGSYTPLIEYLQQVFEQDSSLVFRGYQDENGQLYIQLMSSY